jgi:hypothetical protein
VRLDVLGRRVGHRDGCVRFSAKLMREVCHRIAAGESMREICAEAGMPHRSSVQNWVRRSPRLRKLLDRARAAAGWGGPKGGRRPLWCEVTAQEIFARMCEGETMTDICAEPDMPSLGVVYKWRLSRPEFARAITLAQQIQAERFCDLGWKIAEKVTPEDAYATKIKLEQLRWTAAARAPGRFGRFKAVDSDVMLEAPPEPPAVMIRHFKMEEREEDGAVRVVGFSRDPETGLPVRDTPEDAPWTLPPGSWLRDRPPMWRSWAAREKGAYLEARHQGATVEEAQEIGEAAARAGAADDPGA